MINPHESDYISRRDAARLLMVSTHTIIRMEKTGRIPLPVVKFDQIQSTRKIFGYERAGFKDWAKTNPIRHPGFTSLEKRQQRQSAKKTSYSHGGLEDVYNIQAKRPPFVYSGRLLMMILFCQPALRNGRYSYADCK